MNLFCAICIEEYDKCNNENINLLSEQYTIKLLSEILDSKSKSINKLNNVFIRFKCSHTFHIKCILHCIEYLECYCNKCPMCRQFIDMKFMIRVRELYKKVLKNELINTKRQILKTKFKRVVCKTIQTNNKVLDLKYTYLNNLEETYSKRMDELMKIINNLGKVTHKPCRKALHIYQYSI